ncbi:MAG: phenylalanine--tRNA ligase subunit beta [Planctomycetota bacterium]
MLVSWEWLSDYVKIEETPDAMALKFAMSGLNHEGTVEFGTDFVIDLEVTSNRGDCLGHIGVAREAAVLLETPLQVPEAQPVENSSPASDSIAVENKFVDGCPEYTARIIRGVKVGPSPEWLVRRLKAVDIESVSNVVDITNYVMMECGQPLHAFDLAKIRGNKIIVRPASEEEEFLAINHKAYELDTQMVVIADAEGAVALGGVMGGADSEISETTTDLLIEAARFTPLAIRRAARKLKLQSPASYRFERMPDPAGLDWASRRCCELILELCGGELEQGMVSDGPVAIEPKPITFRIAQIKRVLGIEIPTETAKRILSDLGCQVAGDESELQVVPPSWRTDVTRECDLIEEVARMYGYEQIPEDVAVPIGVAPPRPKDIALDRARLALSAFGIDEAMTPSVVSEAFENLGSFWNTNEPLTVDTQLLRGAKSLRRGLVASLLDARHFNQTQGNRNAELFEVAAIFLPGQEGELPKEQSTLGIVSAGDLQRVKGIVESIVSEVAGNIELNWEAAPHALFDDETGQELSVNGKVLGYIGIVSNAAQSHFSLDNQAAGAELSVDVLTELLQPVRRATQVSAFPAIERDLNFVVDEQVRWSNLSNLCREKAGENLDDIEYCETYRDAKKDGKGKKRILMTLVFRSMERTLTGDEVEQAVQAVVAACENELQAKLLS